ncbi:MAG TPA: nucleoside-diphosphate sugar epimerase/dehydratase [Tepidisphaeraceae bacterium]|jgi:FlaA1/EpsC-like NDP-sugar epimerase
MKRLKRDKVSGVGFGQGDAPSPPAPTPAPAPLPQDRTTASNDATGLIDRLLRRPMVNLDTPEVQRFLAGKRVLVTGAGGSIGSEICRQTLRFLPERLILVEQAEGALFEVDQELRQRWLGADLVPYIADISDKKRIGRIFGAERPQVIFHCAAHKHVPMMELNPGEAIKNNIFGTKVVADAAVACGAAAFVMVSTDKAVNPTSVMGATKRFAELYIQSLNQAGSSSVVSSPLSVGKAATDNGQRTTDRGHTRFVAVRFGNVLGSSGSVVPIFQKQIAAGGPVTVTHPDMRRYFMTIPEASQLVLQAGAIGQGGEIFVLDMGRPVRILDLAEEMIRLSGKRPHEEIAIEFTGMRPGEKLFEELATDNEETKPTGHAKIRVWQLPPATLDQIEKGLERLAEVVDGPRDAAVAALMGAVNEYRPADGVKMRVVTAAA